jgi:hypothetical protein
MGLIVDDPIYHKGELFVHVNAEAKQDLPLGSYVVVDVSRPLSYEMLEHVPNGSLPYPRYGEGEINDLQ